MICIIPQAAFACFLLLKCKHLLKVRVAQSTSYWKNTTVGIWFLLRVEVFDPSLINKHQMRSGRSSRAGDVRLLCDIGGLWENRLFSSNLPVSVPVVDRWIMLSVNTNNRKNPSIHFPHPLILCRVTEAWSVSKCTLGHRLTWQVDSVSQDEHRVTPPGDWRSFIIKNQMIKCSIPVQCCCKVKQHLKNSYNIIHLDHLL